MLLKAECLIEVILEKARQGLVPVLCRNQKRKNHGGRIRFVLVLGGSSLW